MKAFTYEQIVEVCDKDNCLDIISDRAANIEKESKEWKLTQDERRSLYKTVANILDKNNYNSAYRVMLAYLKEF